MTMPPSSRCDISVIIVSFNTRELLRACLEALERSAAGIACETIVVDNNSRDGSAEMVESQFPGVRVMRSTKNLGFAGANNLALSIARGRYLVLLNSDAFLQGDALSRALHGMEADPSVGLAGARLVGRDGSWQPSARMFPSILNDLLTLSGISGRFRSSKLFGRADMTWADPSKPMEVDWVPGAFSIIARDVLDHVGFFDENFFLYYEEVDLCYRIKRAGYRVCYWPDITVIHLGGESSKTVQHLTLSSAGSQLTLWRMRSALLFYRKHHGAKAWAARGLEVWWHSLRSQKNLLSKDPECRAKAQESKAFVELMKQAWRETRGGRLSPARPW